MKIKIFALLLLLFFIRCSCKKETPININLTFIDYYTAQPISGLKVHLSRAKDGFIIPGPLVSFDTLITDINGKITYSIIDPGYYLYYVTSAYDNNYCGFSNISLSINPGATNTQTVKLKKFNFLKINLLDSSNIYHTFSLSFMQNIDYSGAGGYCHGNCNDTTVIFSKCLPEVTASITLSLYKGQLNSSTSVEINKEPYITHVDTFQTSIKY
ncbi:MAG: hypothetical protein ABR968_11880 [Bacteroidales bacterium]